MSDALKKIQCRVDELANGKATEAVLMRFNPREYEILNQAYELSGSFRSRHAWMHEIMMRTARKEIEEHYQCFIDPDNNRLLYSITTEVQSQSALEDNPPEK